jgi:hypothetical protein
MELQLRTLSQKVLAPCKICGYYDFKNIWGLVSHILKIHQISTKRVLR